MCGNLRSRRAFGRALASLYRGALQFGIGLGHHFEQARRLHHGKALHAQAGEELCHCHLRADGFFADQIDLAFDTRIDHDVHTRNHAHGAGHGLDIGGVEIEGDMVAAFVHRIRLGSGRCGRCRDYGLRLHRQQAGAIQQQADGGYKARSFEMRKSCHEISTQFDDRTRTFALPNDVQEIGQRLLPVGRGTGLALKTPFAARPLARALQLQAALQRAQLQW